MDDSISLDINQIIEKKARDPRSNDELFHLLRDEYEAVPVDNESCNDIFTILQSRRDPSIINKAILMCQSIDPIDRRIATALLSQNGACHLKIMIQECTEALLAVANNDNDILSLISAAYSLNNYNDARISAVLSRLKNHDDSDMRDGVVHGLLDRDDPISVQTLVELSSDPDVDVRNWATFGIGTMINIDNAEIRDALYRRTEDEDDEVRGEALRGLARRDDDRVVNLIICELLFILEAESFKDYVFEAAAMSGSSRLYDALMNVPEPEDNSARAEAIAACRIPNLNETQYEAE